MKRYGFLLPVLVVGIVFAGVPRSATATGIGFYVSGGLGDGHDSNVTGTEPAKHFEAGLALDSGIGFDSIIRYRGHLGYGRSRIKSDNEPDDIQRGVTLDNYIGFNLLRGDKADLWVGPDLLVGSYSGRDHSGPVVGLGGAVGVDVGLSDNLTLSLVGGFQDRLHIYVLSDINERLFHLDVALLWGKRTP